MVGAEEQFDQWKSTVFGTNTELEARSLIGGLTHNKNLIGAIPGQPKSGYLYRSFSHGPRRTWSPRCKQLSGCQNPNFSRLLRLQDGRYVPSLPF